MINAIHWYNRSRVRMINKMVHSEIKHAALKLRERVLWSWFLNHAWFLEQWSEQPSIKITGLDVPADLEPCGQGKTTLKQPRNPKNGSGKRFRAYKIPFRKDIRIKNRQRGYLSQTSIWNPQVSNSSDCIPGNFPFRKIGKCKTLMY